MNNTFATVLRALRVRERLTQSDLADALGLGKSTISMYELGEREPDFKTLEKFADYFNVDMNYLIGWTDDQYDYDQDPDNRFDGIPPGQLKNLKEMYGNDLARVWTAWEAMYADARPHSHKMGTKEKEELSQYLEMLRTRPECRVLLKTADGATKDEVEENVRFITALRKAKNND